MAVAQSHVSKKLGNILRGRREQSRRSPEDIAERIGVSVVGVLAVEKGDLSAIRRDRLVKLIQVLQFRQRAQGRALGMMNQAVPLERSFFPQRAISHGSRVSMRR